jgi:hypothetical protein
MKRRLCSGRGKRLLEEGASFLLRRRQLLLLLLLLLCLSIQIVPHLGLLLQIMPLLQCAVSLLLLSLLVLLQELLSLKALLLLQLVTILLLLLLLLYALLVLPLSELLLSLAMCLVCKQLRRIRVRLWCRLLPLERLVRSLVLLLLLSLHLLLLRALIAIRSRMLFNESLSGIGELFVQFLHVVALPA